jgi:hypothetical protein
MEAIVDSWFSHAEALAQNHEKPCPDEILEQQRLVEVRYYGFDRSLHIGQIVVAESVAADVTAFFERSRELCFPIEKVIPAAAPPYHWDDDKLMADNVTSGFNYRLIAGTNEPSLHGKGLAFDVNPRQNPYIRYLPGGDVKVAPEGAKWDPMVPGTLDANHILVEFMESRGWEWGGHWTPDSGRTDYQHFQKIHD